VNAQAQSIRGVEKSDPSSLASAIKLYRGDLLEGFYDGWCLEEDCHQESLFLGALERLMTLHQERGEAEAALEYARWLLLRDPLRADIHRQAMRLHAHQGDRAAVLQQYLQCQAALREQLSLQPAPATTALYRELLGEAPREPVARVPSTQPGLGRSPLDTSRAPLVERADELATMQTAWERAKRGQGHIVLIEGEAGMSKTRLLEEFADRVRWQGGQVAQGRCYKYNRPLPYCAITEALHDLLGQLPVTVLSGLPAWVLAAVSHLVPEMSEMRANLSSPVEQDTALQQTRLLDALTRFLKSVSSISPLLLVLDDLHWASDSTLTLLQYLAPRIGDKRESLVPAGDH
jgi:tetratricopeptide (TPR) repeat protein